MGVGLNVTATASRIRSIDRWEEGGDEKQEEKEEQKEQGERNAKE